MTARDWTILAALSLVWGGAFFLTELLLPHVGPATVAAGRVAVAAAGLWVLAALRGAGPAMTTAAWGRYILAGAISFAIPFLCFAVAQTELTGGLTAIINAMTPIMMVLVSHFYPGGEKAAWLKGAGVAVGFFGVAMLILAGAADGFSGPAAMMLIALIGPFFYGVAGNYTRVFKHEEPTRTVTGTMTGAALVAVPAALAIEGPPAALPIEAIIAFLGVGLISTAAAFRMMYVMLPRIGPTNFSIVTFLVPISAMALGAIFLGERIDAPQLIGMAVIFCGLVLVDGRLPRLIWARLRA